MDRFVKEGEIKPIEDYSPVSPRTAKDLLNNRKSITFQEILDFFDGNKNNGEDRSRLVDFTYRGFVSDEVMLQAMRAGFRYREHIGPIGERIHVFEL